MSTYSRKKIPACYHFIFSVTQKEDIKVRGKDKDFFLYHLSPQNGIFLPFRRQGKEFRVRNSITLSCTFIKHKRLHANEKVTLLDNFDKNMLCDCDTPN